MGDLSLDMGSRNVPMFNNFQTAQMKTRILEMGERENQLTKRPGITNFSFPDYSQSEQQHNNHTAQGQSQD